MARVHALTRMLLSMAVALLLVVPGLASAQTTGTIKGQVIDEGGLAIPGVLVTVSSEALIGGAQQQTTDENGRFLFTNLPPGTYEARFEMPGFNTVIRPSIRVLIGRTAALTVEMKLQTAEEEVIVEDVRPTLDVEKTSKGEVLTKDFLSRVPTGRSYQSAVSAAPGVTGGANPNVSGAAYNENSYLIDGVNITDPVTGTFSINFNFDAIEQLEVMTGAFDPEYGQNLGGVINIVTETGGNTLSFNTGIYYETANWAPKIDARYAADGAQLAPSGFDSTFTIVHVASKVSGPIIRDRAWFIISYELARSLIANTGIDLPRDFEGHYILAKLTTQPTAAHRITALLQADPTTIDNIRQSNRFVSPDAQGRQAQGGFVGSLQWDWFFSPEVFVESKATVQKSYIEVTGVPCTHDRDLGYNPCEPDEEENHLDLETPARYGINGAFSSGNYFYYLFDDRWRFAVESKTSVLQREFFGTHDIKFGAVANYLLWDMVAGYPGNLLFYDWNYVYSDPDTFENYTWIETSIPFEIRQTGFHGGAFVQDVYKPVENLTVRYGIRYDRSIMRSDQNDAVINLGVFGPRFYLSWDPFGDERTKITGGYGRFTDIGNLGIASYLSQAGTGYKYYVGELLANFESTADNLYFYDPLVNNNTAAEYLTAPHSDEFTVGGEREIVQDLVFGANFQAKFTRNVYAFDETNFIYDEDGFNHIGTTDSTLETYYRLRTPDQSRRDYYQTDLQLRKNFSNRWLVLATYSYVVSRGTVQTGGSAGFQVPPQADLLYGNLPTDVRHQVKASGAYDFPWDPWTTRLGAQFQYFSGYPVTRYYYNASFGSNYLLKQPVGEYARTEPVWYLDVQVQQAIHVRKGQLWLDLALENVVNAQNAQFVNGADTYNPAPAITSENRWFITERQRPLNIRLGLRYQF